MAQTWSIEAFAEEIGGGFIGNQINNSKQEYNLNPIMKQIYAKITT